VRAASLSTPTVLRVRSLARPTPAVVLAILVAAVASGCGSSSTNSSGSSGGGSTSAASSNAGVSPSGAPNSGPGLTQPTAPAGAKVSGGTVYFTEAASAAPNYIFPMTSAQVCGINNLNQLSYMLYRGLYWYGNNYRPTVDYSYSLADPPVWSADDHTVTIHLKPWKWSDGEAVTARDVEFWINMYKASPTTNYCGYVPGYFPDNVVSMSSPNPSTVVLNLNKSYNPTWFLYNELSQIWPLPLAWDRTSLSQPAPTSDNGHLADSTKAGAEAVYKFLDKESRSVGSWTGSPIWSVVDGPYKLQSFTTSGQVTLVPNADYSGTPKATLTLVELPFTSDTAIFNEIRSGGPSAVTIANLPAQYAPQISAVKAEGYDYNEAASYSVNYFPLNLNNPTVGPIFKQLYFRQAFQHLIDQDGWTNAFLNKTANPTYSPIPPAPPSPLVAFNASTNPYPFSTADAATLLKAHGWKVVPNGQTTCSTPSLCGAGITAGEPITFNIDYEAGVSVVQSEMNDLQAQAKKVGITINLTSHPFDTVIGTAIACTPSQPTCKWTAQNWGAGWIYGPDYLPTGESLFAPGSVANYGSYNDPHATALIQQTIFGPDSGEKAALSAYAAYMEQQLPVVFGPTSIGTYAGDGGTLVSAKLGGYAANALGMMNPEDWYLTR
jgi:peptide/nickel transport system substrate-binding protein